MLRKFTLGAQVLLWYKRNGGVTSKLLKFRFGHFQEFCGNYTKLSFAKTEIWTNLFCMHMSRMPVLYFGYLRLQFPDGNGIAYNKWAQPLTVFEDVKHTIVPSWYYGCIWHGKFSTIEWARKDVSMEKFSAWKRCWEKISWTLFYSVDYKQVLSYTSTHTKIRD